MTDSSQLPPPPPPRPDDPQASKPSTSPYLAMTLAALLLAGVLGFLWLGARNGRDDATFERDAAITERNAANEANITANARLQTTQDELADARAELENANTATDSSTAATPEELQELQDQVDDLTAEVGRLEDENATLATSLDAAQSTTTVASDGDEPADTTPPSTQAPETTTTTTTAPPTTVVPSVDPGDIGEQIAGLFRRSVLGSLQELCLGQAVLDELGEARVVEAIASDSPGGDEEFIDAIRSALPDCNIDPSAIFG